ncbi:hypothetical protein [Achromobacter phage Motura]|uniref:Uncharacterized protein n=1 Tax=Achromobacter phage Motura TaxID=2591403 RepID=A0A514CSM3_9CAUD|nr:hypothetical protein H1O15_gp328 [Achromobacter phage Motura]QDH83478.1 hypothetical protein [Achromobacter phage Motura]
MEAIESPPFLSFNEDAPMSKREISNFDKLQAKQGLAAKNLSQMSKISDYGTSTETEDKFLAANRTKAEATLTKLRKTRAFVQATLTKVSTLPLLESKHERMIVLSGVHKKLEAARAQPLPTSVRGKFNMFCNEVASLKDGVFSEIVDKREMTVLGGTELLATIDNSISRQEARLQQADVTAASEHDTEKAYQRAAEIINNNRKEADRLDSIKNREFVVARAPIVAMTQTPLSVAKLKHAGIAAEDVSGYPMVRNQLVLGINKEALESPTSKRKMKPEDAAAELLKSISASMNEKVQFVTEKPYPYKGALWYWIGTTYEINALMKAAGGRLVMNRWGFAF